MTKKYHETCITCLTTKYDMSNSGRSNNDQSNLFYDLTWFDAGCAVDVVVICHPDPCDLPNHVNYCKTLGTLDSCVMDVVNTEFKHRKPMNICCPILLKHWSPTPKFLTNNLDVIHAHTFLKNTTCEKISLLNNSNSYMESSTSNDINNMKVIHFFLNFILNQSPIDKIIFLLPTSYFPLLPSFLATLPSSSRPSVIPLCDPSQGLCLELPPLQVSRPRSSNTSNRGRYYKMFHKNSLKNQSEEKKIENSQFLWGMKDQESINFLLVGKQANFNFLKQTPKMGAGNKLIKNETDAQCSFEGNSLIHNIENAFFSNNDVIGSLHRECNQLSISNSQLNNVPLELYPIGDQNMTNLDITDGRRDSIIITGDDTCFNTSHQSYPHENNLDEVELDEQHSNEIQIKITNDSNMYSHIPSISFRGKTLKRIQSNLGRRSHSAPRNRLSLDQIQSNPSLCLNNFLSANGDRKTENAKNEEEMILGIIPALNKRQMTRHTSACSDIYDPCLQLQIPSTTTTEQELSSESSSSPSYRFLSANSSTSRLPSSPVVVSTPNSTGYLPNVIKPVNCEIPFDCSVSPSSMISAPLVSAQILHKSFGRRAIALSNSTCDIKSSYQNNTTTPLCPFIPRAPSNAALRSHLTRTYLRKIHCQKKSTDGENCSETISSQLNKTKNEPQRKGKHKTSNWSHRIDPSEELFKLMRPLDQLKFGIPPLRPIPLNAAPSPEEMKKRASKLSARKK